MKHLAVNIHYEQEQAKLNFRYSKTFLKVHPLINKFIFNGLKYYQSLPSHLD